ncbi:MAG: 4-(cytidine 5'-diphospho)-2-C-methyl-D-erythritol kinase [Methylophilaceae bacterium]
MPSFASPAKINLFLHITGRRADGYHELQSVFRLLDFGDTVHISIRQDGQIKRTQAIEGVPEELDLTIRAAKLLQATTGCGLGADIHVEKRIPMGGGLGGGSSNAATVLLALNRLWNVNLKRSELLALGLTLGADVPIFIFGENAWAEGIGEALQAISLQAAHYVVLTPPVKVSTAAIFTHQDLTRDTLPAKMSAFSEGYGSNDLQPLVCRLYPEVASCLNWLRQFGDARMSGSGASVFVAVESLQAAQKIFAARPSEVNGFVASGLDQHPLITYAD